MATTPRLDLSDLPKIEMPKFEMPKFEMPKFEGVEMPDVELPSPAQVVECVRDAAYVGIGFVVVTAERIQELNKQLLDMLTAQLGKVRDAA